MRSHTELKLVSLLICLLPLATTCFAALSCSEVEDQNLNTSELQSVDKTLLTQNVQKFCDLSVYQGVNEMNMHAKSEVLRSAMPNEVKMAALFKEKVDGDARSPMTSWQLSWLPNSILRSEALNRTFDLFGIKDSEIQGVLNSKSVPLNASDVKSITDTVNSVFNAPQVVNQSGLDNKFIRTLACAKIALFSPLRCNQGLSEIKDITHANTVYMLPQEHLEVFTKEEYREGLRIAALKIKSRVASGKSPEGDLFSDIKNAFIQSGVSSDRAEEMTWTTIGVLSAGGPNLFWHWFGLFVNTAADPKIKPALYSLGVISQSLPILDLRSRGADRFYSYPPGVKTSCDNGKPYHFWMSAYLAHKLTKDLRNPEAASAATFTFEKAYQFLSQTAYRRPGRSLTVDTFDSFNNIMRIDMTYAAAGAAYGASGFAKKNLNLNIDDGIKIIVNNSKLSPSISQAEAEDLFQNHPLEAYREWDGRFAPDSAYNFFEK